MEDKKRCTGCNRVLEHGEGKDGKCEHCQERAETKQKQDAAAKTMRGEHRHYGEE